jgi:cell division septal protein FtsQ
MEIKTGKKHAESEASGVEVPPDRGRPRARKTAQNQARTRNFFARLLAVARVFAGVSLVALLVLGAFASYRYARSIEILHLNRIQIEGCQHSDAAQLESIVRREFSGNLLQLDLAAIRARLERETWIRRTEIRRILPETLRIRVQERVPSVIAEIGGELQLLDNEGVLLDQYNSNYGKLDVPVFSGLKGDSVEAYQILREENAARIRLGVEILGELASGDPEMTRVISEMDLSDESNIKLLLVDDTAPVYLGDRDFFKRFQMLMTNLSKYQELKAEGKQFEFVDLRFDPQIIYRIKPGTPDQPGAAAKGAPVRN